MAALLSVTAAGFVLVGAPRYALAVSYNTQEIELVNQLNDYRESLGLQPLMVSDLASDAAEKHSSDMGKYSFFSHKTAASDWFPIGANACDRMFISGYWSPISWGENIAAGYVSASGVMDAWKNSPEHNEIMTGPSYCVVGVGVVHVPDSPFGYYWTLDFGVTVDATAHWLGNDDSTTTSSTTASSTTITTVPPSTTSTTVHPSPTTTTLSGSTFADVPPSHSFYVEITCLARDGIVSGGSDGLFHPDNPVTRAQFAKIIILALGKHTAAIDDPASPSFTDVRFTGADYPFDYVEEATALHIIEGYPDGTFRPQASVTRAQLALMLARAGDSRLASPPADYVCPFLDVPSYALESVRTAMYNTLVDGKTATIFDAYGRATRGQVAKMMYRLRQTLGF